MESVQIIQAREAASADKYRLDTTAPPVHEPSSGNNNESPLTSPITSPPYWVQSHQRSVSNISVESIADGAITLQDNTDGDGDSKNKACWAKSVEITDFVTVNGSRTNIGAFVVWNITVDTLRVRFLPLNCCAIVDRSRVVRCESENDTPNSTTCETSSFKRSRTLQQLCHLCLRRASYLSSGRSFSRIVEEVFNTFSSGC